ncbi:DUF6701 domain-containing protein [Pseudoduganella violaceinigra]|uniref:DUF6701 domain-containing protein n=1 Tax=Pseudoduganella violaceinigra TaxID=246602 RepID=UPI00040D6565|nr:DUF6701 domain-containing protein [Pseudoduganella violaceinigra]
MIFRAIIAIFLWCAATLAHAQSYTWPADLTGADFNCTLASAGQYNCPAMDFSKDAYIVIAAPITVHVNGDFSAAKNFIIPQGKALLLDVKGKVTFAKDMNGYLDIISTGSMKFGMNTILYGDLNSGDDISIDKNSLIDGDVFTKNDLTVDKNSSITGDCSYTTTNYNCHKVTPPSSLDHFLVEHAGTGLTCAPSQITVWACGSAASGGTCPTTTSGANGTLQVKNAAGAVIASYAITIPSGQTSTTIAVPYSGTKSITLGTDVAGTACWNGATASCQHVYNDSGFDFNVPDHVAAVKQTVTVSAIKLAGSNSCAPAFSGAKTVALTCTYVDPSSAAPGNTRSVLVESNGVSKSLTCNSGNAQALDLAFDSSAKAQIGVTYPDAGKIQLSAQYATASMQGSDSFTAYPASFQVNWPTPHAATIAAGAPFNARVVAINGAASPAATPNFGRESTPAHVDLSFIKCKPVDGDSGLFSGTLGAFSGGSADSADSTWDEAGTGDIVATSANYLATGRTITGSSNVAGSGCTGAFGRFRPHHFTTVLEPAATWAYSGQPFGVKVNALNAAGSPTQNYYVKGGDLFSRDVSFTAWSDAPAGTANPGPGSMTTDTLLAGAFTLAGEGTANGSPRYTFATPLTKPTKIVVRATDADGTSSSGFSEAKIEIRSGRIRISNSFGSRGRDLDVPIRAEYYSGNSWLLHLADDTTVLPPGAFALSPPALMTGVSVSLGASIKAGRGSIRLSKPSNAANDKNGSGTIDVAANLGATTADNSCLVAPRPASTGANQSWLRSLYGSCNANWTQDPSARATFGATNPENRSTIYGREVFN